MLPALKKYLRKSPPPAIFLLNASRSAKNMIDDESLLFNPFHLSANRAAAIFAPANTQHKEPNKSIPASSCTYALQPSDERARCQVLFEKPSHLWGSLLAATELSSSVIMALMTPTSKPWRCQHARIYLLKAGQEQQQPSALTSERARVCDFAASRAGWARFDDYAH